MGKSNVVPGTTKVYQNLVRFSLVYRISHLCNGEWNIINPSHALMTILFSDCILWRIPGHFRRISGLCLTAAYKMVSIISVFCKWERIVFY